MLPEDIENRSVTCVAPGVQVISPFGPKCGAQHVTVPRIGNETLQDVAERTMLILRDIGASIASMDVLGLTLEECMSALEEVTGPITWPVTWIADAQIHEAGGIQVWAEIDARVAPVMLRNFCAGSVIDFPEAIFVRLGGLTGRIPTRSNVDQTNASLRQMINALKTVDMDFSNVVRTWFYNCDIVSWYREFNETRDIFFAEHDLCEGLIPASTGIGACNVSGSSIVTGLLAVQAKSDTVTIAEVPSPLQCPATDYGSSFSRAVEIRLSGFRQLLISGTASIDAHGKTIYKGDIDGQILHTLEVVETLLKSRQMHWHNVTRAIAYVKYAKDIDRFEYHRNMLGLGGLPVITLTAVVCRDDLLFEMELDAVDVK